mmetsp:Transcript_50707/g.88426  ORF Transcript_50707/g.88426 Transcript_50707/m.88426 type:complete len:168 (+) Transcript_50707:3-506(+)
MARRAAETTGRPLQDVLFEICIVNADKGAIAVSEMQRRVEAIIAKGHRCLITRAPLFAAKAELCRDCDFALGFDTYRRIVDPKYYVPAGESLETATPEERRGWVLTALRGLRACGIRMAVAGRLDGGEFKSLSSDPMMELPEDLEGLFVPIPEFRLDISSSEIRAKA